MAPIDSSSSLQYLISRSSFGLLTVVITSYEPYFLIKSQIHLCNRIVINPLHFMSVHIY